MKRIFIIAIFLIAAALLAFGLVFPKKRAREGLQKIIQGTQGEIRLKESYFSSLRGTAESLKIYSSQLSKIDSALPESSQLPILFDFLQKAGSQAGLVLSGFSYSPQKSSEVGGVAETAVSFSAAGPYSSFKNFLLTLENSARLIQIENISFANFPDFNFKIKIHSY